MTPEAKVKFIARINEAEENTSVIVITNPEASDAPIAISTASTSHMDIGMAIVALADYLSEETNHLPDRNDFFDHLLGELEKYRRVAVPYAMVQ